MSIAADNPSSPPPPVSDTWGGTRVRGLDAIRFLSAFVVVMHHFGANDFFLWLGHIEIPPNLPLFTRSFFNGAAAVGVFFIVSGFCIHYPVHRQGERIQIVPFLARRWLRIGLPYLAGYLFFRLMGFTFPLHGGVFWSLVCELIYYSLYPALLAARRRAGSWRPLLGASLAIAVGLNLLHPEVAEILHASAGLAWLYGLPLWLAGCVLAEQFSAKAATTPPPSRFTVGAIRLGILGLCAEMFWLQRAAHVNHTWTLLPFAAFAACWLHVEMLHARQHPPPRWLEGAGAWSYSLYITHLPAKVLVARYLVGGRLPLLGWIIEIAGVLLVAWLFYLAVEAPGHALARRAGRWLSARQVLRRRANA